MKTVLAKLAGGAVAALLLLTPPAQAAVQQVPGTRVTLDLPDGYEPRSDFVLGFVHPGLGVRFIVTGEMSGRFLEGRIKSLASPGLRRPAPPLWRDPEPGSLQRTDRHGFVRLKQTIDGQEAAIFLLVFGGGVPDLTAEIVAVVPQDRLADGTVRASDIETILASARIADTRLDLPEPFRFGGLGRFTEVSAKSPLERSLPTARRYRIDPPAGRRINANLETNFAVLPLRIDGPLKAQTLARLQDHLIADRSRRTQNLRHYVSAADRAAAAAQTVAGQIERVFTGIAIHSDVELTERRPVEIAGMSGVELVGRGSNAVLLGPPLNIRPKPPYKVNLVLYQVVLEGKDALYLIMGQRPTVIGSQTNVNEFRRMALSFGLIGRGPK